MERRALLRCVPTAVAMLLMFGGVLALAGTRSEVLKDGTKVEIKDGDQVFAVCPCSRGAAIAGPDWKVKGPVQAKDGTYTLRNGKTIQVKDGRLVNPKG